jgi:predicted RNase H-like HicB family nuclease
MAKRAKHLQFTVLIEQDEDGIYVASVPGLPGCHTQAKDLVELQRRIRAAIRVYLKVRRPAVSCRFVGMHQVEVAV